MSGGDMNPDKPVELKTRSFTSKFESMPDGVYVLLRYGRKAKVVTIKTLPKSGTAVEDMPATVDVAADGETVVGPGPGSDWNPEEITTGSTGGHTSQTTPPPQEPEPEPDEPPYPLPPDGFSRLPLEKRKSWVRQNWPDLIRGDGEDDARVQERLEECRRRR